MSRRRFFVDRVHAGEAKLEADEARHLTQVLRVEAGQRYEISDNSAVYLAEVVIARKQHVTFRILEDLHPAAPLAPIALLISLVKFERLELLLEKATELGVGAIHVVKAERSEKGLDQGAHKRIARWQRIVLEASQQSRRDRLPELHPVVPLNAALRASYDYRIFLDEEPGGTPLLETVSSLSPGHSVGVLVGPEGGWPEHERESARSSGWIPTTLGPQVLRTETAAIAALSIVNAVINAADATVDRVGK